MPIAVITERGCNGPKDTSNQAKVVVNGTSIIKAQLVG